MTFAKLFLLACVVVIVEVAEGAPKLRCPPLPFLKNGRYRVLKNVVKIECDPSYMYVNSINPLTSSIVISCKRGRWTDPNPTCEVVPETCDPPLPPANGRVDGFPPYEANAEVQYSCDEGFVLDGSNDRRCQPGILQWTGSDPVCEEYLRKVAGHLVDEVEEMRNASELEGRIIGKDVEVNGLDLFWVFDKSSSIHPKAFADGIEFAKFLTSQLSVANGGVEKIGGTRLSVVTFGDVQKEEITLTDVTVSSTKIALQRLDAIKCVGICDGSTNMQAALAKVEYLVKKMSRPKAKKALFITSDGVPNAADKTLKSVEDYAQSLKDLDVEIYTIGIGHDIDEHLLRDLASEPSTDHYFLLKKFPDFRALVKLMREEKTQAESGPNQCGFLTETGIKQRQQSKDFVKAGSQPWLVAIIRTDQYGSKFTCSGALICHSWVLTSAQCLMKDDAVINHEDLYIVLGEDHLAEESGGKEQYFYAEEIFIQDEFIATSKTVENDMALIKLAGKANFTDFVRPVCLPHSESVSTRPDTVVQMVGWLTTSEESIRFKDEMPATSMRPKEVNLEILATDECKRDRTFFSDCTNANVGASIGGQFSKECVSDRGSLIVADIDGRSNLIGVVSRAQGCKLDQKFAIYTRSEHLVDWITLTTDNCIENHI